MNSVTLKNTTTEVSKIYMGFLVNEDDDVAVIETRISTIIL